MPMHQPAPESLDRAMHELEEIIARIENGQVPFEQAIASYQRGRYLLDHCRVILDEAGKTIAQWPKGEQQS